MGNAKLVAAEAVALAAICKSTAQGCNRASSIQGICTDVLQLPRHHQHTIMRSLLTQMSLDTALCCLPFVLHLPLVESLVEECADAQPNSSPARKLLLPVAQCDALPQAQVIRAPLSAQARAALCAQIPRLPALVSIDLSDHNTTDEGLPQILAALQLQTQLTAVNLAGNEGAMLSAQSLGSAMQSWRSLQELLLGDGFDNEVAGADLAQGLGELQRLTKLQIGALTPAHCSAQSLASLQSLQHLDCASCTVDALLNFQQLTFLSVRCPEGSFVGDEPPFALALARLTRLRCLDLNTTDDWCPAPLEGVPCGALTDLEHLQLDGFGDFGSLQWPAGINLMAEAPPVPSKGHCCGILSMPQLLRLTYLGLKNVSGGKELYSDACVFHLASVVPTLPDLKCFVFDESLSDGHLEGLYMRLHRACSNAKQLQTLSLKVDVVCFVEELCTPWAQLRALDLELCPNDVSCVEVLQFVMSLSQLTCLWLGRSEQDDRNVEQDSAAIIDSVTSLRALQSLTLSSWDFVERADGLLNVCSKMSCLTCLHLCECFFSPAVQWVRFRAGSLHTLSVAVHHRDNNNAGHEIKILALLRAVCASRVEVLEATGVQIESEVCLQQCLLAISQSRVAVCTLDLSQTSDELAKLTAAVNKFNEQWYGSKRVVV